MLTSVRRQLLSWKSWSSSEKTGLYFNILEIKKKTLCFYMYNNVIGKVVSLRQNSQQSNTFTTLKTWMYFWKRQTLISSSSCSSQASHRIRTEKFVFTEKTLNWMLCVFGLNRKPLSFTKINIILMVSGLDEVFLTLGHSTTPRDDTFIQISRLYSYKSTAFL